MRHRPIAPSQARSPSLPWDIIIHEIAQNLDFHTLVNLGLTCWRLQKIWMSLVRGLISRASYLYSLILPFISTYLVSEYTRLIV